MIRLSKYLSLAGVTSRRGAEEFVKAARVTINDRTVEKIGTIVDEASDVVKVDGAEVSPEDTKIYILLNKPRKVMTTLHDPFQRRTVCHYLKRLRHRVYPVGRLDFDTEGVLLLSNDGDLAYRLTHPRYEVAKTYEATVAGHFTQAAGLQIEHGIKLEDGATGRARVEILSYGKRDSRLRLTLTEGRKREVRQLCRSVGHPVRFLRRTRFAGLTAAGLKPGAWRHLTEQEVAGLKKLTGF